MQIAKILPLSYGGVETTSWPSQPLAIQAARAQDHKRGQDASRGRVAMQHPKKWRLLTFVFFYM